MKHVVRTFADLFRHAAGLPRLRRALVAGSLWALASCGGGGDEGPPRDDGNNRIPVNCQVDRRACI